MRRIRLVLLVICAALCISFTLVGQSFAQNPRIFDKFGDLNCEDEMAHLDNLAVTLHNEPKLIAYIFVYGGRVSRRGEAKARASRIRTYLVRFRGIASRRIITIDGGYREELEVELWPILPGVVAPTASPRIHQKEVEFRKGRIKKRDYFHCGDMY